MLLNLIVMSEAIFIKSHEHGFQTCVEQEQQYTSQSGWEDHKASISTQKLQTIKKC